VIASPIRPRDRQESGIAAASQLTHPRNALRRFTLVRNHNAPMASFRHALTEAPQRTQPHWNRPVNSEPRPCLFDVGFPLSGPQVRTSTSDLKRHALHTRFGLRPQLRRARPRPQPPEAFAVPNPHTSTSPQRRRQHLTNAATTLKPMDSAGQQKERCSSRQVLLPNLCQEQLGSTSSCPRPSPPQPSTASCTTPTSSSPTAKTATDSRTPPPARG
jgi:hypothetical protein